MQLCSTLRGLPPDGTHGKELLDANFDVDGLLNLGGGGGGLFSRILGIGKAGRQSTVSAS